MSKSAKTAGIYITLNILHERDTFGSESICDELIAMTHRGNNDTSAQS